MTDSESPQPSPQELGPSQEHFGKLFQSQAESILNTPENRTLYEWYRNGVEALPEFDGNFKPLTNGKNVIAIPSEKEPEQLDHISNEGFFQVRGYNNVLKGPDGKTIFTWEQAMTVFNTIPIQVNREGRISTIDVSGFIFGVVDEESRLLLTIGQEPASQAAKRSVVRTPAMSAGKAEKLLSGDNRLDPVLGALLPEIFDGKSFEEYLKTPDLQLIFLNSSDGNRQITTNVLIRHSINSQQNPGLHKKLTLDGKNIWATPQEVLQFQKAQLTSDHTNRAAVMV